MIYVIQHRLKFINKPLITSYMDKYKEINQDLDSFDIQVKASAMKHDIDLVALPDEMRLTKLLLCGEKEDVETQVRFMKSDNSVLNKNILTKNNIEIRKAHSFLEHKVSDNFAIMEKFYVCSEREENPTFIIYSINVPFTHKETKINKTGLIYQPNAIDPIKINIKVGTEFEKYTNGELIITPKYDVTSTNFEMTLHEMINYAHRIMDQIDHVEKCPRLYLQS